MAAALASLQRSGAITAAVYQQDYSAYLAAKRSLAKLSGTRRTELGAVLANVQAMAGARLFTASRLGSTVPHAGTQPQVVDERTAALRRASA